MNISAVQIMLLSLRCLRLLTTQFPSFGALFDTIKIAQKDLFNIFVAITIIMIGFTFATMFILGSYIEATKSFFKTLNMLFDDLMGVGQRADFESPLVSNYLSDLLFI